MFYGDPVDASAPSNRPLPTFVLAPSLRLCSKYPLLYVLLCGRAQVLHRTDEHPGAPPVRSARFKYTSTSILGNQPAKINKYISPDSKQPSWRQHWPESASLYLALSAVKIMACSFIFIATVKRSTVLEYSKVLVQQETVRPCGSCYHNNLLHLSSCREFHHN